ncbi:hypothetical protein ACIQUG_32350 [Ensifer sp. NPDC090286]|uniref:hypothetical protein n=1 Tax=Ensifer sp. NPDC090286 TaxID=3363991 RepID=UPI00383A4FE3
MNFANAHATARFCTYVVASHCAFDAAKIAGAIEELLREYPFLEPTLLTVATIGLVWHLAIHHSRLALLLSALHFANLTIGWLHLGLVMHVIDHSWHVIVDSPVVYVVLASASISVVGELATRRAVKSIVRARRWLRGSDF